MYIGLPSLRLASPVGEPVSPADIVDAWVTRVTGNGGTVSGTTADAVEAFVTSAIASGYWSKLNRFNLFCGTGLAACLTPLKIGGGAATDTNVNFVEGDYAELTGLTGNGTTKYLRTGLIPSVSLSLTSAHASVYNRQPTSGSQGIVIGARESGAISTGINVPSGTGSTSVSEFHDTTTGRLLAAGVFPLGHIVGSRTSSSSHTLYQAGASIGTNATSGGTLPTIEMYVGAINNTGAPSLLSTHPMGGYSIGAGLTSGEVTAFSTHMQTFQTALGRNV